MNPINHVILPVILILFPVNDINAIRQFVQSIPERYPGPDFSSVQIIHVHQIRPFCLSFDFHLLYSIRVIIFHRQHRYQIGYFGTILMQ